MLPPPSWTPACPSSSACLPQSSWLGPQRARDGCQTCCQHPAEAEEARQALAPAPVLELVQHTEAAVEGPSSAAAAAVATDMATAG